MKFEIPPQAKRSNCSAPECRLPIFWVLTPKGKNMPCNPDGTSHFDTCVKSAKFKTEGRKGGGSFSAGAGATVPEISQPTLSGGVKVFGRTDGKYVVFDPRRKFGEMGVGVHDDKEAALKAAKEHSEK